MARDGCAIYVHRNRDRYGRGGQLELALQAEMFSTAITVAPILNRLRDDTDTAEYEILASMVSDPEARSDQALAATNEVFQ